jgi:pyruvate-formate lyase-activating enzyme
VPERLGIPQQRGLVRTRLDAFFLQLSSADAAASTPVANLNEVLLLLESTGLASPNWADWNVEVSDIFNLDLNQWHDRFDELTVLNGVNNGNG